MSLLLLFGGEPEPVVEFLGTGTLTLTADVLEQIEAAVNFAGTGSLSLTADVLEQVEGNVVFTGSGLLTLSAEVLEQLEANLVFTGTGTLTLDAFVDLAPEPRAIPRILGCGQYQVQIEPRGGGRALVIVPWRQINFGRVLDNFSNCTVQLAFSGQTYSACCDAWNVMEPLEHEIVVYRDGEIVWVGPLLDMQISQDGASINGRDLSWWLDRRFLPVDRHMVDDLADIFNKVVEDAMSRDPSPNITVHAKPTGIEGVRDYQKDAFVRAGDAISELARTGVDYTMVGRHMLTGGLEIFFPEPLRMWEPAKRLATVRKQGVQTVTEFTVIGKPPGNNDVVVSGTATGQISRYGLLQNREAEPFIEDRNSMEKAAEGRLAMLQEPPYFLNFSCSPEAPFGFNDLVPGRQCDVRIDVECERVFQMMRLQSVAANVVATNEGGVSESVDLTLVPLGIQEGDF